MTGYCDKGRGLPSRDPDSAVGCAAACDANPYCALFDFDEVRKKRLEALLLPSFR